MDELKKELAWSHVKTKEVEVGEKLEDLAKANRKIPRVEAQLAEARVCLACRQCNIWSLTNRSLLMMRPTKLLV